MNLSKWITEHTFQNVVMSVLPLWANNMLFNYIASSSVGLK
jgi:hypothetical protein